MNELFKIEKIYFTTVFNSIPDNIIITDKDNEIVYANDNFKKFTSNYSANISKSSFKFDYKKHIETNNIMFNNNINSFDLIENDIVYRKKMIKDLQYILTFGEDKSNVKIVSNKLVETIVELKKAESEVNLINDNLNSLLNFIFKIENIEEIKIEDFLIKVFNYIYEMFDKVDCGSIYIVKDNKVNFLDAKGHNLEKLKKITIFGNSFKIFETSEPIVYKKIINASKAYYYEELKKASLASKETLKFSVLKNNEIVGAISLDITENSSEEFTNEDIQLVDLFSRLISIVVSLVDGLEKNKKLTTDVLFSFVNLMKIHSAQLYEHSINVGEISKNFAIFNKLSKFEIEEAYWSGLMHDMGFLLIASDVLYSNDLFENLENNHIEIAYNIMKDIDGLKNVANNIYCHHENYDGSGYPRKINGLKIPFIAQIVSISNFYETMINIDNKSFKDFIKLLNDERNKSFDSKLVDKFIEWVTIYENK
jgi:HD-GYP domain-containing protein (c-di-GMP phosphodiesterase class II)